MKLSLVVRQNTSKMQWSFTTGAYAVICHGGGVLYIPEEAEPPLKIIVF